MATETEQATLEDTKIDIEENERDQPPVGTDVNPTENDSKPTVVNNEPQQPQPPKKRPKLDLNVKPDRKRGKSMFGLLLGTLNKAKLEDKQRNATDAAKKRQLIDQRLQTKIARETETVRRAEESKKDRQLANRKEEDLALKDSIQRNRFTRLIHLSNFLLTSDDIRAPESSPEPEMEDDDEPRDREPKSKADPLKLPPRSHPPPVYFLPSILLPSQRLFLEKRKEDVKKAVEVEQEAWYKERKEGVDEIVAIRAKVEEEESKIRSEKEKGKAEEDRKDDDDAAMQSDQDERMEVEDELVEDDTREKKKQRVREPSPAPLPTSKSQAMDEDDAVEY